MLAGHVCMHACMRACVSAYFNACARACSRARVGVCMCLNAYVYASQHALMHLRMLDLLNA